MASVKDVLDKLQNKTQPEPLKGMAKYGTTVEQRLGVSAPELTKLANGIGKITSWQWTHVEPA